MKVRWARTTALGGVVFSFLLAACNFSLSSAGPGPRAWIDTPLDGSVLEPGLILVQSHVAGPSGVTEVALVVNGTRIRVDAPADTGAPITSIGQAWDASAPGEYTLQVEARDASGALGLSIPVRVTVGGSLPTPTREATPTPVPSQAVTLGPTLTPTSEGEPVARLTANGNCRSGPGTVFGIVTSYETGTELSILGRDAAGAWWLARKESGAAACWISIAVASAIGPVAGVPVVASPPTPTAKPVPPEAPGALAITARTCVSGTYSVTLGWADNADTEAGYRIYRNGTLLATLGAGATSYTDNPPGSGPYVYGVEAYNAAGASSQPTVNEAGCVI